jgi:AcrR family transcriptional regulator
VNRVPVYAKLGDVTVRLPRNLRVDAQDNHDRILAAARTTFATESLDVPMRELARRAGVGAATLYRHFPTKEALVVETFAEQMAACTAAVATGLVAPDPWHGFCQAIEQVCVIHARNRGFTAAFMTTFPHAIDFTATRNQAMRSLAELISRARTAGRLRPDFTTDDLILILRASGGIQTGTPAAARRFATLLIQGIKA